MQAIQTTYKGPTDTRGSRIIAKCAAKRISVPYNHALDIDGNHWAAAAELVKRLGWTGHNRMHSGTLPDGSFAHVFSHE